MVDTWKTVQRKLAGLVPRASNYASWKAALREFKSAIKQGESDQIILEKFRAFEAAYSAAEGKVVNPTISSIAIKLGQEEAPQAEPQTYQGAGGTPQSEVYSGDEGNPVAGILDALSKLPSNESKPLENSTAKKSVAPNHEPQQKQYNLNVSQLRELSRRVSELSLGNSLKNYDGWKEVHTALLTKIQVALRKGWNPEIASLLETLNEKYETYEKRKSGVSLDNFTTPVKKSNVRKSASVAKKSTAKVASVERLPQVSSPQTQESEDVLAPEHLLQSFLSNFRDTESLRKLNSAVGSLLSRHVVSIANYNQIANRGDLISELKQKYYVKLSEDHKVDVSPLLLKVWNQELSPEDALSAWNTITSPEFEREKTEFSTARQKVSNFNASFDYSSADGFSTYAENLLGWYDQLPLGVKGELEADARELRSQLDILKKRKPAVEVWNGQYADYLFALESAESDLDTVRDLVENISAPTFEDTHSQALGFFNKVKDAYARVGSLAELVESLELDGTGAASYVEALNRDLSAPNGPSFVRLKTLVENCNDLRADANIKAFKFGKPFILREESGEFVIGKNPSVSYAKYKLAFDALEDGVDSRLTPQGIVAPEDAELSSVSLLELDGLATYSSNLDELEGEIASANDLRQVLRERLTLLENTHGVSVLSRDGMEAIHHEIGTDAATHYRVEGVWKKAIETQRTAISEEVSSRYAAILADVNGTQEYTIHEGEAPEVAQPSEDELLDELENPQPALDGEALEAALDELDSEPLNVYISVSTDGREEVLEYAERLRETNDALNAKIEEVNKFIQSGLLSEEQVQALSAAVDAKTENHTIAKQTLASLLEQIDQNMRSEDALRGDAMARIACAKPYLVSGASEYSPRRKNAKFSFRESELTVLRDDVASEISTLESALELSRSNYAEYSSNPKRARLVELEKTAVTKLDQALTEAGEVQKIIVNRLKNVERAKTVIKLIEKYIDSPEGVKAKAKAIRSEFLRKGSLSPKRIAERVAKGESREVEVEITDLYERRMRLNTPIEAAKKLSRYCLAQKKNWASYVKSVEELVSRIDEWAERPEVLPYLLTDVTAMDVPEEAANLKLAKEKLIEIGSNYTRANLEEVIPIVRNSLGELEYISPKNRSRYGKSLTRELLRLEAESKRLENLAKKWSEEYGRTSLALTGLSARTSRNTNVSIQELDGLLANSVTRQTIANQPKNVLSKLKTQVPILFSGEDVARKVKSVDNLITKRNAFSKEVLVIQENFENIRQIYTNYETEFFTYGEKLRCGEELEVTALTSKLDEVLAPLETLKGYGYVLTLDEVESARKQVEQLTQLATFRSAVSTGNLSGVDLDAVSQTVESLGEVASSLVPAIEALRTGKAPQYVDAAMRSYDEVLSDTRDVMGAYKEAASGDFKGAPAEVVAVHDTETRLRTQMRGEIVAKAKELGVTEYGRVAHAACTNEEIKFEGAEGELYTFTRAKWAEFNTGIKLAALTAKYGERSQKAQDAAILLETAKESYQSNVTE